MFAGPNAFGKSQRIWRGLSIAGHCIVLLVVLRSPKPIFVKPSGKLFGKNGTATRMIYFPRLGSDRSQALTSDTPNKIMFPKTAARKIPRKSEVAATQAETAKTGAEQAALAGSPQGSLSSGPINGHEVRPAFPVVYPDPVVARSEIPSGVIGDVVVEVTIDERGTVTATRVVQPLGYGLEDKVIAVLRNWRFMPATMDGVAIPSQQDVHFHFPS
jgi:TonB family protein